MMSRRRVVAMIQARMGSQRLPGKVLLPIGGHATISVIASRLRYCDELDGVVVATTTSPGDDQIAKFCRRQFAALIDGYSRGPEKELDQRLLQAANEYKADAIVRITADCPLVDPGIVDALVSAWRTSDRTSSRMGYFSNVHPNRTYPDGLDVEVISRWAIAESVDCQRPDWDHEAFTTNIWAGRHPIIFGTMDHPENLGHLRWTVDNADDLYFVRWVFDRLPDGFGWKDVLGLREAWDLQCRRAMDRPMPASIPEDEVALRFGA